MNKKTFSFGSVHAACIIAVLFPAFGMAAEGQTFKTPDAAANALVEASRNNDSAALKRLFDSADASIIMDDSDPGVEAMRERFAEAADEVLLIEEDSPGHATIIVGPNAFPYPVPLVKKFGRWKFDAAAGAVELANRRVGLNELMTMTVLEDLPRLQSEYARAPHDGSNVRSFAKQFLSSTGKQDGLYWDAAEGESQSPLGPLLKDADAANITSYYGYNYRMLTQQGAAAAGGAYDYVINGNLIGGYAAIAFPAKYGDTGIMTFLVNSYGVVYQKDLGEKTDALAAAITSYDPDSSWTLARDEVADDSAVAAD